MKPPDPYAGALPTKLLGSTRLDHDMLIINAQYTGQKDLTPHVLSDATKQANKVMTKLNRVCGREN